MTNEAVLQATFAGKGYIKGRGQITLSFEMENNEYNDALVQQVLGAPVQDKSKWVTIIRMAGDERPKLVMGNPITETSPPSPRSAKHEHGDYARKLYTSGFFLHPEVWEVCGSDAQFLEWIRTRPSCLDGDDYNIQACHVRRVKDGAGTAIKPPYCAVPMTETQHILQSSQGETSCLKVFHTDKKDWPVDGAKQWFDKQRLHYVQEWAKMRLKAAVTDYINKCRKGAGVGPIDPYVSLADIHPGDIGEWAKEHNLTQFLPKSEG